MPFGRLPRNLNRDEKAVRLHSWEVIFKWKTYQIFSMKKEVYDDQEKGKRVLFL